MNMIILLPLIILAVCFALRVPVGYSMFCACIAYFIAAGKDIGLVADMAMNNLYSNSTFVAVLLFIFTANIMNSGKVTDYMFTFTKALVGKKRGAMAHINIIISLIFSGMSGSAMADVSGIGTLEIAEMKKDGYDAPFSCAITAATSVVGPIFPPSIPLVVYAILAGVSVGKLFMGGMIPAVILCIVLAIYVWYISKKRNYPRGVKFTKREFLKYTTRALPALITPVILLGGMYSGIVTPTEAGALAAFYAIIISVIFYRSLSLKEFFNAVKDTVIQTGIIMVIATGAWVLAYVVTSSGMGNIIANWIIGVTENKYLFLLLINISYLILGMLFDSFILLYVITPLVIPVAVAMGINMVHFGVVLVLNMMIGGVTPPYGVLCFTISGLGKAPLQKVFKEVIPMVACLFAVLLLITYIPDIVMAIPNWLS